MPAIFVSLSSSSCKKNLATVSYHQNPNYAIQCLRPFEGLVSPTMKWNGSFDYRPEDQNKIYFTSLVIITIRINQNKNGNMN